MKILIVAGPYEADRIRRAAVSAGVEAVAVEPGESLSGWITATRPEVIVLAPRVISPEPAAALAKIRAVPRGRVPILLVGDAEEEAELRPMADGFFVRPVAADDLIQQARAAMAVRILRGPPEDQRIAVGPAAGIAAAPRAPALRAPALRPLVGAQETTPMEAPVTREVALAPILDADDRGPATGLAPAPFAASPATAGAARGGRSSGLLFEQLEDDIEAHMDADLEAEVRDVVRAVDGLRKSAKIVLPLRAGAENGAAITNGETSASVPSAPPTALATPLEDLEDLDDPAGSAAGGTAADRNAREALSELTDESSQKTLEVPQVPPAVGDELDLDPPALFARMYLSRLSGRLTVRRGKVKKHVVFERGHPVLAGSNREEDRLGEMLVRQGRLTSEQASSLGDEAAATGRRLGLVLVERGLIAASELTGIVRRHYEEIVYSLFGWDKGSWTLGTDASIAAEKVLLSLHPAALILEGIRRGYGTARTIAALGGSSEVFQLRPWAGLSELLDKMALEQAERRVVLLFDGMQSLAAIAAGCGVPAGRVYALAWALFVLDRLEPAPIGKDVALTPRRAAAATTNGGGKERDEAIDRALVQARAALVADGDYFQILGVPRDAGSDEIRRAHQVLSAGLVPSALHPAVAADLEGELREIRLVLDEAMRLLLDENLRQSYRTHLGVPPTFAGEIASGA